VANYGEIWREKRRSAELLKVEGWQFFQLCGKYQADGGHKKAFPHFAAAVEEMIAREVGEYFTVFDPSLAQNKVVAEQAFYDLVDKVREKLDFNTNGTDDNPLKKSRKEDSS
jgi:hypothetical protein